MNPKIRQILYEVLMIVLVFAFILILPVVFNAPPITYETSAYPAPGTPRPTPTNVPMPTRAQSSVHKSFLPMISN